MRCAQALESARLYAAARAARTDADAARAQAETANAAKAMFLSTMSHELRTPLNAIGGYAQIMEMGIHGPVTADQQLDLASIQRSQTHLLGLVEAVLSFAQIEAGHVVYHATGVALADILTSARTMVAPQMLAKGVKFEMGACSSSLMVRADPDKARQVIVNLLANATKFTPSGGLITLACAPALVSDGELHPRMSAISVTDTGIGIPADKLANIFDPFVQLDRDHTSSSVGVGLGLAISRELARGMGGELTVQSPDGGGCTFTLFLPNHDA